LFDELKLSRLRDKTTFVELSIELRPLGSANNLPTTQSFDSI
jgi:hypothetical protein